MGKSGKRMDVGEDMPSLPEDVLEPGMIGVWANLVVGDGEHETEYEEAEELAGKLARSASSCMVRLSRSIWVMEMSSMGSKAGVGNRGLDNLRRVKGSSS